MRIDLECEIKNLKMISEEAYGKYPGIQIEFENGMYVNFPVTEHNFNKFKRFFEKYEVLSNRWYEKQRQRFFKRRNRDSFTFLLRLLDFVLRRSKCCMDPYCGVPRGGHLFLDKIYEEKQKS